MAWYDGEDQGDYINPQVKFDSPRYWMTEDAYIENIPDYGLGGIMGVMGDGRSSWGMGEDAGETTILLGPGGVTTEVQTPTLPGPGGGGGGGGGGGVPWYQSLVQAVVPAAANIYAQKQLTDLNIQRARSGLPMLTASQYSQYQVPTVTVGPSSSAQKWMMYGAIGVGGLVLLRALKII
jgi:hypothetical protein